MATNYDRRRRESMYEDIDAYARRAVDAEIADRDRRPPPPPRRRFDAMTALAWIVLLTLAAGVALVLAVNSGLLPESLLGHFARSAAPAPTITTRPITEGAPGFTSDTRTAPAANIAADVAPPVSAQPEAAGDVVLGHPELVGDAAPVVSAPAEQPTPSEAESGMGGGAGMACDLGWNTCQAVDIVPLAEPHAEIAAPESDVGWGRGGGSGAPAQPTPDAEHKDFGNGGGGGQACDSSWNNCEVTP